MIDVVVIIIRFILYITANTSNNIIWASQLCY